MKKIKLFFIPLFLGVFLNANENIEDEYKIIADKVVNEELCQMGFISFYKQEYAKSEKLLTKCLRVKETSHEEKQKGKLYLIWQVFQGKTLNYDQKTIEKYLYELSAEGNMQSQYLAGMMYLNGKGVKKDYKKAAYYFRNASQSVFQNMMFPDNLKLLHTPIKFNGVKFYNKMFDMKFTINDEHHIFNNLNIEFELRTDQKDLLHDYNSYIKENMFDLFKSYDYKVLASKEGKNIVKKDIREFLNKQFEKIGFPYNVIDEVVVLKYYFDI